MRICLNVLATESTIQPFLRGAGSFLTYLLILKLVSFISYPRSVNIGASRIMQGFAKVFSDGQFWIKSFFFNRSSIF